MKTGFKFNPLTALFDLVNKFTIRADGNTPITNPVTLVSGSNVTLTQLGDVITISANGSPPPVLTGYFFQESYLVNPGPQSIFPLVAVPFDVTQLVVRVNGRVLLPSEYTFNAGLNEVTITAGVPVASTVHFFIGTGQTSVLFNNEVLVGAVDGSNPQFTLSTAPLDNSGLLLLVDGRAVHKSQYIVSGLDVIFNTASIPNFGQAVHAVYQYSGSTLQSVQEVPLGVVGIGNYVFGPARFEPNEASSLVVLVDGVDVDQADYTLVGKSVVFSPGKEPVFGQSVEFYYYFVDGINKEQVEYFTLNAGQVADGKLQLTYTPREATEVMVDIIRVGALEYAVDYESEENTIFWNGLGFESDAIVGTKIRVHYFI